MVLIMTLAAVLDRDGHVLGVSGELYGEGYSVPREHLVLHLLVRDVFVVEDVVLVQQLVIRVVVLLLLLEEHLLKIHVVQAGEAFKVDVRGQCERDD